MAKKKDEEMTGPSVGEFVQPPELNPEAEERSDALPEQEAFWKPPVRFGSVPVEKEPLGWDRRRGLVVGGAGRRVISTADETP